MWPKTKVVECCRLAKRIALHCLPIDVVSLLYACYIYHTRYRTASRQTATPDVVQDLLPLYGLCVAKCHGLAASLAFVASALHRCHSLKRCANLIARHFATMSIRRVRCCWPWSRRTPFAVFPRNSRDNGHAIDGIRWLASGLLHAAVHIALTHPFAALPSLPASVDHLTDILNFAFAHYRWTLTGYVLLLLSVAIVALGRRLLAFARLHVVWRNLHVSSYVCIALVTLAHSSNYSVLAVTLSIMVGEAICTLVLVERVRLEKMEVTHSSSLDGGIGEEDMVTELQFTSQRFSRRYRCGDYVRLYAPSVALFETHAFTVMKHQRKAHTFRVFVRSVGRWTSRLSQARDLTHLYALGPYGNEGEVSLDRLLYVTREELATGEQSFYHVDPSWTLNLVCTGIAITRHLALLGHLVACYENRACCAVRNYASMRLPGRVRLIWLARNSFDVNLAIAELNDMQRKLAICDWSNSLLSYDIFVSREPTELELANNTRRQLEMFDRGRAYSGWLSQRPFDQKDGESVAYTDAEMDNYDDRFERVLHEYVNRCGERLYAKRSWRPSGAVDERQYRRLENFYQRTNLRVGARADNWRQLLHVAGDHVSTAETADSDTSTTLSPMLTSSSRVSTTTILTTVIRPVMAELQRLYADVPQSDVLYVELLW